MKTPVLFAMILMTGTLLWNCSPAPGSTTTIPPTPKVAAPTPKTGAPLGWDAVLAEAKKEGTVSVYALWRPETRIPLTQAFKEKYGINVEFSPFSRGVELLARVAAEQRAGLYTADVFGAGGGTLVTAMKPENVLGPIEPLLMLPEVTDARYWSGGKFPFIDKDRTSIVMIASLQRHIMYNTELVKKGEITTYKDLLKPQYKKRITLNDPTVTGAGKDLLTHLALNIWNLEEAKDYLRQLVKQQEVVIERDNRLHVETVARGKYAVGLAPNGDTMANFLKLGAPIDAVVLKEGVFVASGAGAMAVPVKSAHPNATRVFINWLLGKEGQTVFSSGFGSPSLRDDVSKAEFNPLFLPQPGERIFLASEESLLFTDQLLSIAKQIIDEASR